MTRTSNSNGSRLPEAQLYGARPGYANEHGHEGLRRLNREWSEAWDEYEDRCEQLIDAGDHVIAIVTRRGRGRASKLDVSTCRAGVWTIRDGKVVKVVWFTSAEEACEAAGAPERSPSRAENVEIVRRAVAAAYRRPKPDFDTINALYHSEHEQISYASRVEGGSLRGARGFREWLDSFDETFESWTARTKQVREIDNDRVLFEGTFTGISKRGGVPVEQHFALVVTVRDGKITRTETYASPEEALAALSA